MTIDIFEPQFAQPRQLGLDVKQLVGRILINDPEPFEELCVERRRRRGHVLQVAKRATWRKAVEDFAVERTLPRVREVMDRKAGDHLCLPETPYVLMTLNLRTEPNRRCSQ